MGTGSMLLLLRVLQARSMKDKHGQQSATDAETSMQLHGHGQAVWAWNKAGVMAHPKSTHASVHYAPHKAHHSRATSPTHPSWSTTSSRFLINTSVISKKSCSPLVRRMKAAQRAPPLPPPPLQPRRPPHCRQPPPHTLPPRHTPLPPPPHRRRALHGCEPAVNAQTVRGRACR